MIVNETGDVVADVKDEPDRGESRDAVKINLHKVSNDVSVEKSHGSSEFRFAIAELQYHSAIKGRATTLTVF
jgi:hypothetical protein